MRVFILLFLWDPAFGSVHEADRTCRAYHTCLNIGECPAVKEKHEDFKRCKNRPSRSCGNLQRELREAVCNKAEKAVCCPDDCVPRAECKYADDRMELYKSLKGQNERKASEILNELKDRVCDRKNRLMWCPVGPLSPRSFSTGKPSNIERSKPDYLPRLGSCGVPAHPGRIVGGTDTQPGEFPFAALLGFVEKEYVGTSAGREITRDKMNWVCGGTLINQWYVLTAAHCQGKSPETTISRVRLGEWSVEGYGQETDTGELPDEQDFDITENNFKVHEGFKKVYGKFSNIVNDIALVKLPRPAKLNAGVQMACLPFNSEEFKNYLKIGDVDSGVEGRKSTVIGWGKTNAIQLDTTNGVGSTELQKLQVPILNQNQCNAYFSTLESSQLCAGGEKKRDSCRGDSGGGLLIQDTQDKSTPWYLIGIVSFGSRECGNGRPGIYTRVSSFIPWIVNNLK